MIKVILILSSEIKYDPDHTKYWITCKDGQPQSVSISELLEV